MHADPEDEKSTDFKKRMSGVSLETDAASTLQHRDQISQKKCIWWVEQ